MENKAHRIFLDDYILLSKKDYTNWREIQDEYYDTFHASLPPLTCDELIEYLSDDYGSDDNEWPFSRESIIEFYQGDQITLYSR